MQASLLTDFIKCNVHSIHKIAPKNIVRDFESEYKNALKKETESFMIQSLILSYFIATSNICRMK